MMASGYNPKEDEEEEEGGPGGGGGMKSRRRPDNTAFRQQRLPAWQPVLTAGSVLPAFLLLGLLFIPVGIGLFVTSNNIKEFQVLILYIILYTIYYILYNTVYSPTTSRSSSVCVYTIRLIDSSSSDDSC